MRILRIVLLSILTIGVSIVLATTAVGQPAEPGIQMTPIGHRAWKPVDFHVYTAPIGTAQDGYAEFQQNMIALLPPPKHQWCNELGIGPGTPHHPPYNHEIDCNLDRIDFRESLVFRASEFSPPNGIWA